MTTRKERSPSQVLRKEADIEEDFIIGEVLGEGTSGVVHRLVQRSDPCQVFAGKLLDISSEDNRRDVDAEVQRLTAFSSEFTIKLFSTYYFEEKAWLVLEYCAGGSLYDLLCSLGRPLSEPQCQAVAASVLLALNLLHARHFTHQDIKASNLLLTGSGKLKLCDFGEVDGTLHWMAPELLSAASQKKEDKENGRMAEKKWLPLSDVWSLGITLLELGSGKIPHINIVSRPKVIQAILQSDAPALQDNIPFSADMKDFVAKCLQKSPQLRPSVRDLLQHKWVKATVTKIKSEDTNTVLLDMFRNIADMKRQKEAADEAFRRQQAHEQWCRCEREQEEEARDAMAAAEEEMLLVLALQREVEEEAERRRLELEAEEALAREAAEKQEKKQQRRREVVEMRLMRREDWESSLAREEAAGAGASLRCPGADVLKRSDYRRAWNSRHFMMDRTLITYFIESTDTCERGRFLITAQTQVRLSSSDDSVVVIQDGPIASPRWSLRLKGSASSNMTAAAWLARMEACIFYAKNTLPALISKRLAYLEESTRCRGWVLKESQYLGQMNRRFLLLEKGVLRYFNKEVQYGCTECRGQFTFTAATTATSVVATSAGNSNRDYNTSRADNNDDNSNNIDARGEVSLLLVEDKAVHAPWSITFECPLGEGAGMLQSATEWLRYIRAHIALVS